MTWYWKDYHFKPWFVNYDDFDYLYEQVQSLEERVRKLERNESKGE